MPPSDVPAADRGQPGDVRGGSSGVEAPLEVLQLSAELPGQPVPEAGIVLVELRQLLLPLLRIDLEQPAHRLLVDVEAVDIDTALAGRRHHADRGLDGLRGALTASE